MTRVAQPRGVIYGLSCTCHPEKGIRYVGQTTETAMSRFSKHKWSARNGKEWPVCGWIRKHGEDNVQVTTLEVPNDLSELDDLESRWIHELNTLSKFGGLNLWPGGAGVHGYTHPANALTRRKGPKHSEETKRKISEAGKLKTGELASAAKLTCDKVRQIKVDLWSGNTALRVAQKYGVTDVLISLIRRNKHWADVPWPIGPTRPSSSGKFEKGTRPPSTRFTEDDIREIRRRYEEGQGFAQIGRLYETSGTNIGYICKRVTWKDVG